MPSQATTQAERIYNSTCTIARSLEVIGARWSLLILREAVNGITRFADFRELLGIAPDVLSDRLATLVDAGILEKQRYQAPGERPRDEYILTERGRDLRLVMAALHDWGDKYVPSEFGVTTTRRRISDDAEVHVAFVDAEGRAVPADEVYSVPRDGTPAETFFERRRELVERAAASR